MPRTTIRRRLPVHAGSALLLACTALVLGLQRPALAAPVTADPAAAAAGWLTTQLVDGDHIEVGFDGQSFPDYGLTADTILALAAAGVGGDFSTAATDYLEANVELYVGAADGVDDPDGEYYAGSLAKTILVSAVTGRDATDFGGVDLLSRLLSTETPEGRFSDVSQFGDFSNNIGQSLAVLALVRVAPDELSGAAPAFLVAQRCSDGGANDGNVPLSIGAKPCAGESISIDTTGFAIQALLAADLDEAASAGLSFLAGQQADDGGFSDLGAENSNSTGLAAQALRVGGLDDPADAAVSWLRDRQVGCSAPPEQQGAIAFTDGPDGQPLFDDRATRATSQAIPGIVGVGLLDIDAAGSTAEAPRLDCHTTPSPSPTPTPSDPGPTASPSPTGGPTPTDPGPTAGPTASAPGLPVTGTDIGPLLGVAAGSLLIGGVLLLVSRRRTGVHR